MAKKQTRRSISVSRGTYERLKAFCEANHVSMSQFVETRVGDFLGEDTARVSILAPATPSSLMTPVSSAKPASSTKLTPPLPRAEKNDASPRVEKPETAMYRESRITAARPAPVPMTSVAARFAFDPPPPMIRPKQEQPAPKPVEKRPDQIFTF